MSEPFKWQVVKSIVSQWDQTKLWGYFYKYGTETKILFLCKTCVSADKKRSLALIREVSDNTFAVWFKDGHVPDQCERC